MGSEGRNFYKKGKIKQYSESYKINYSIQLSKANIAAEENISERGFDPSTVISSLKYVLHSFVGILI